MKVKDIMSKNVITCKLDSSIYEVARLMQKYNIGFIIIDDLKGVITDRDLIKPLINHDDKIEGYISNPVITVNEEESTLNALKLMSEHKIKRLVVTNKDIVGVLSLSDIINHVDDNLIIKTIKEIWTIHDNKHEKNSHIDEFYL